MRDREKVTQPACMPRRHLRDLTRALPQEMGAELPELEFLLHIAERLPYDQLPLLLGEIEVIRCTALARLTCAARPHPSQSDQLLTIDEAARRLSVSKDYLYRRSKDFSFTRRIGRKLLFSSLGIDKHIEHKDGLTARRQRSNLIRL